MLTISPATLTLVGLLVAALSALAGGAAAYGALRSTVEQLRETVRELRTEVAALRTDCNGLRQDVAVLSALAERGSGVEPTPRARTTTRG